MARRKVAARPTGRPVIPIAIEVDGEHVLVTQDGRVRDSHKVVYSEYDIGRMKAGYVCLKCHEDLDTAFPDVCPICGFEMADKQSERFALEYQGTTWVGPTTTEEEELAIMQEMRARRAAQGRPTIEVVKPQIIVPRGF